MRGNGLIGVRLLCIYGLGLRSQKNDQTYSLVIPILLGAGLETNKGTYYIGCT